MNWHDWTIVGCQVVMLLALWPTLRDKRKWPHRTTAMLTAASLITMAGTFGTIGLNASAMVTACLGAVWLRMTIK